MATDGEGLYALDQLSVPSFIEYTQDDKLWINLLTTNVKQTVYIRVYGYFYDGQVSSKIYRITVLGNLGPPIFTDAALNNQTVMPDAFQIYQLPDVQDPDPADQVTISVGLPTGLTTSEVTLYRAYR